MNQTHRKIKSHIKTYLNLKHWHKNIQTKSSRPETLTPKLRSGQSHRHRGVCRQGQFRQGQGVVVFTAVFTGNLRGKQGAKSWANLTPDGSFLGIIIQRNMFICLFGTFTCSGKNQKITYLQHDDPGHELGNATFPFSPVLRGQIRRTTARVKGSLDLTEPARWIYLVDKLSSPMSYPLVIADIAIENGHWNSGFSHW